MNGAVLHLEVRNQNGVQPESHRRSESVALQKQAAEFYKHNSHYYTDTGFNPLSRTPHHTHSYAFLRLKVHFNP